jgi:hypothetical protein
MGVEHWFCPRFSSETASESNDTLNNRHGVGLAVSAEAERQRLTAHPVRRHVIGGCPGCEKILSTALATRDQRTDAAVSASVKEELQAREKKVEGTQQLWAE